MCALYWMIGDGHGKFFEIQTPSCFTLRCIVSPVNAAWMAVISYTNK
uniref:Uncharacterized protein n=1 Tax=Anguilla anguilla TaxID=7936 RepID=A0A0E9VUB3_ANGAN